MNDKMGASSRSWLRKRLDSIDWVFLGRFRNSILARAISVLSIASLFLANAAPALREIGLPAGTFERLFVGSIVFLAGSLIYAFRAPPQIAAGGEVVEIVSRMRTLTDWEYFTGLRTEAENAHSTASAGRKHHYPPDNISALGRRLTSTAGLKAIDNDWIDRTAGLYQTYLELIKYSRPVERLGTAFAMMTGAALLFWPVVKNVLVAVQGLIL